jgi:hypothetical protein
MIAPMPHEIAIGGVYLPPMLIAASLGVVAALVAARTLNRFRLSRYVFYPPLVFMALAVLFTLLFGSLVIPI